MALEDNTPLSVDSAAAALAESRQAAEKPVEQAEEQPNEAAPEAPAEAEQPEAEEETEAEAEAPEEQATEEVSEEAEEAAEPSIEPPTFYSKAQKEAFASLPGDQQQAIVKLAKDGEQRVSRIESQAVKERTEASERLAVIEQERNNLQNLLLARLPQPPDDALIDTNPQEYLRQQRMYERGLGELQQIVADGEARAAKQQEEIQKAEAEHRREQQEKLVELIPELTDPAKAKQVATEIISYGKAQGYDDETLNIANASDLLILHKAMKWDRAQAAAKQAKAKTVPKVSAPGVARTKAEVGADQRRSVIQKLNSSGTVDDAYAALTALRS